MKRFVTWIAVVVAISGCASETEPTNATPAPKTPSAPAIAEPSSEPSASENTATDEVIVIDVRSQEEWDSGHVEQAVHIPHTEIADRISEVTTDKDAKIVLYCAVGGRAGKAKSFLEKLGYTNVENGGGYEDVKDRF